MSKGKIIVVGAGAWGGWSAYMLQKAGYEVTLVDQYGPGNERSGSGGKTRVIRMAYGGDPDYTRMTHRSFELWKSHELEWGDQFYHETGALWLFNEVEPLYATKSKPLMERLGYPLEEMAISEVADQYPQINVTDINQAYWEPKCGYLEAARATEVVAAKFQQIGGKFLEEKIIGINGSKNIESLLTESGTSLQADRYVFACGPWVTKLFPQLSRHIYASRQEVYYYQAPDRHLAPDLPIWIEFMPGDEAIEEGIYMRYGIPDHFGAGFKVAYDERNVPLDPDKDSREVMPDKLEEISETIAHRFPALKDADLVDHRICVYENSTDGEFIMDQTPVYSNGILLAGSSGHGFKMGPAVGEMLKDHVHLGDPFPEVFRLARFDNEVTLRSQYEVD